MSKRLSGFSGTLARYAATVLGTVIAMFVVSNGAIAEPIADSGLTASSAAVDTENKPTPFGGISAGAALDAAASQIASFINIDKKPAKKAETNISQGVDMASNDASDPDRKREINCLAEAIYFEARGEPERGKWAVAEVVKNRVESRAYPNTYCAVTKQRKGNICQFSWACDPGRGKPSGSQWEIAQTMATKVYDGHKPNVVGDALFFHATFVKPSWSKVFTRVGKIGSHIFYSK